MGFAVPQRRSGARGVDGKPPLAAADAWVGELDLAAFGEDVKALGRELVAEQARDAPEHTAHLRKIVVWCRACQWAGLATAWYAINPLSIFLLSLGTFTRWACVMHHVAHGGYDKTDKAGRYNRFRFALGSVWRRCVDWLDWMEPAAWNCEHNQLHHYHLGEPGDPDLVEHNLALIREARLPRAAKYAIVFFFACTWKWAYYATSTYKVAKVNERRRKSKSLPAEWQAELRCPWVLNPRWLVRPSGPIFFTVRELVLNVYGPYLLLRFALPPLAYAALLGRAAAANAAVSLLLAEVLTNLHAFVVITTNHAGDDLYRFDEHCAPRSPTFFLRAIISSANFPHGGDANDFLFGWLNYQVEHHMWPDLSMLSYRRAAPRVRALCARHGVPYVQHSVWWRLKQTVAIMVGAASMRPYPKGWAADGAEGWHALWAADGAGRAE